MPVVESDYQARSSHRNFRQLESQNPSVGQKRSTSRSLSFVVCLLLLCVKSQIFHQARSSHRNFGKARKQSVVGQRDLHQGFCHLFSVLFFIFKLRPQKPLKFITVPKRKQKPKLRARKTAKFNPSQKQNPKRSRVKVLPRVCVKRCTAGVKVWEAARWICLLPCFKAKRDQYCLPCSAAVQYWLRFWSQSALPPGEYQKISLCIRPTSAT